MQKFKEILEALEDSSHLKGIDLYPPMIEFIQANLSKTTAIKNYFISPFST